MVKGRTAADIRTVDGDEAAELLERIEEQQAEVDRWRAEIKRLNDELKFQKEQHEAAGEKLASLIRARGEDHPLFDGTAQGDEDE